MTFSIPGQALSEQEPEIGSGDFWPPIDPSAVRAAQRIDGTIEAERLREAIIFAIASVNAELAAWKLARESEGIATLVDVDADEIDGVSVNVHRYRRAVGCMAKASILERYQDYDSTARGDRKADVLVSPIDDLRRDARWAIADITGTGRTIVELI